MNDKNLIHIIIKPCTHSVICVRQSQIRHRKLTGLHCLLTICSLKLNTKRRIYHTFNWLGWHSPSGLKLDTIKFGWSMNYFYHWLNYILSTKAKYTDLDEMPRCVISNLDLHFLSMNQFARSKGEANTGLVWIQKSLYATKVVFFSRLL